MELLVADVPGWFVLAVAFCFGASWGSFFNVAIYRWPRDLSVVSPGSECPGCGTPVAARYNIPIFGYLILRGKTACCGQPLSLRYPFVEALSAVLCVAVAKLFVLDNPGALLIHAALTASTYFAFVGGLVIATFVDLDHMEIPDEVSLPGAALGLASVIFRNPAGVGDAALGAGAGFLVIQLVFVWSYEHLTGRRGMGEGDSKLLMMIGAFTGWQGALFALFAGAAQGLVAFAISGVAGFGRGDAAPVPAVATIGGPPLTAAEDDADGEPEAADAQHEGEADADLDDEPPPRYWGHMKLPFGPFLALGALEFLFFGEAISATWFDLLQRLPWAPT